MNWQNYRFMRYKDLYVPASEMPRAQVQVTGEVRFVKRNSMGQVNYDSGWQKNRIVDTGLDAIGGVSQFGYPMRYSCYVGTSNAATTDNMIQLVSKIGSSVTYENSFRGAWNNGAPNYDRWNQDGFRFSPGNGTGTLREVGFHPNDEDKMFARHVMSPEITKAADETLDVYHRFGMYPDVTSPDQTGQVTLNGELFDWTCRPWNMGYTDWTELRSLGNPIRVDTFPSYKNYCTNADLQAINTGSLSNLAESGKTAQTTFVNTSSGSGGDSGCDVSDNTYVPGSYTNNYFFTSGLNGGNLNANPDANGIGIRRIILGCSWYDLQVAFYRNSDGFRVPKDETMTMTVEWSKTWARRP